jgi:hypothetical protein
MNDPTHQENKSNHKEQLKKEKQASKENLPKHLQREKGSNCYKYVIYFPY